MTQLSFFKVGNYTYQNHGICDYRHVPRPHYCMGLILRGKGNFVFGEKHVSVAPGDIIFVPIGSQYVSEWTGEPDVHYISVHFSFEISGHFLYGKSLEIQKVHLDDFAQLCELYTRMYEEAEEEMPFGSLGAFYEVLSRVVPKLITQEEKIQDSRIEKAIHYIRQNYTRAITVEELANLCYMSVSHFHALFKEMTGISPIEYRHRLCVRRGELMLLADKSTSVETIAEMLGFCSAAYFRRMFKKITGMTPREYRKAENERENGE